ncbi:MAG: hypothetical protein Q9180_005821 [Flavoplaca navasiana]
MADGEGLAAEELLAKTRHCFQTHLNEPSPNIMVYAYANLEGLSKACLRENRTKAKELRQFVGQFNARYPLFNFIDVGYGDQRADCKIQGLVRFYLLNKLLVVGPWKDARGELKLTARLEHKIRGNVETSRRGEPENPLTSCGGLQQYGQRRRIRLTSGNLQKRNLHKRETRASGA